MSYAPWSRTVQPTLPLKVILTIPGAEIADAVMGCGSTTGRNMDKAEKFGIELAEIEGNSIKIPFHSRVAIQCSLKEYYEVGDHYCPLCRRKRGKSFTFTFSGITHSRKSGNYTDAAGVRHGIIYIASCKCYMKKWRWFSVRNPKLVPYETSVVWEMKGKWRNFPKFPPIPACVVL